MSRTFKVVPDAPVEPLSSDEAVGRAKVAFQKARRAQVALVTDLSLTGFLYRPDTVTYLKLKMMRSDALDQVTRAQAVADALTEAIEAMEATRA